MEIDNWIQRTTTSNEMEKDPALHIFEWAPIGMLLFESEDSTCVAPEGWVCTTANGNACNMIGRLPLEGLTLAGLFPEPLAISLADPVANNPSSNVVDFFVSESGIWLLASGNRVATRLIITLTNITLQKEAAFSDHRMLTLYRSLSNSLSDNEIILFDKELNILHTQGEPRFVRLNTEGELKGKKINSLFDQNEFAFLDEYVTQAFGSGRNEVEKEINGTFYKASVYYDKRDHNGEEHVVGVLLLKDVTELNKKQRELEMRVQQLDRSNKELEDFAYVASHDLQEPLRKIKSFGERLQRKYGNQLAEEGQMYITRMREAAKRMERLIDDLLVFSRATTKNGHVASTDLQKTLAEVIEDLHTIERKQATIEAPDNLPFIDAMPSHMQQLFQNIIDNALKFSKPGISPVISIQSRVLKGADWPEHILISDEDYCLIEFKDNGIGFEQDNAIRIFTIFQRLHGRSEYAGSGIGLSICKKIVDNYNGVITAKGEIGVGSVFTVILPIRHH